MIADDTRDRLARDAGALLQRLGPHGRDPAARDALLARILRWQAVHVPPYARLARRVDRAEADPARWPPVPTDVFRFARVAAHGAERDVRRFQTSGTTSGARGTHAFADLSLYDAAARACGERVLFPREGAPGAGPSPARIVSLVAHDSEVPDSSLSYMVSRYAEWFGDGRAVWAWHDRDLDVARTTAAFDEAVRSGVPVALLATSFALVFLDEQLGDRSWALPPGSRVMYTGGFKGRTREIEPDELIQRVATRLGIPSSAFLGEYGMTELSSQCWSSGTAHRGLPLYEAPGWVRVSAVDPETLEALPGGSEGLLRLDDGANLDSAAAILTSDRALVLDDRRFVLLGRQAGAVPRGCSLAIEEALG
jgi:acyl-CoA synthetase (AMP-forming)/AMP-acid ligase II